MLESLFSNKVCRFIKKTPTQVFSCEFFAKSLRTLFLQNISGGCIKTFLKDHLLNMFFCSGVLDLM